MSAEIGKLIQLESEHIKTFSPPFSCVCNLVYDLSLLAEKGSVCMTVCIYIFVYM